MVFSLKKKKEIKSEKPRKSKYLIQSILNYRIVQLVCGYFNKYELNIKFLIAWRNTFERDHNSNKSSNSHEESAAIVLHLVVHNIYLFLIK